MTGSADGKVTLVLEDGEGQQESHDVSGPGGKIRFAFGRPGHRSGVWVVLANNNKSDVYVFGRTIAGVQKFSLHESGDWRHQWVTAGNALKFTGRPARILDQWPQPPPAVGGWTKGLSIRVPRDGIQDITDDDQPEEGVLWLPEPRDGHIGAITVVVARTDQGLVPIKGAVPVDGFYLADGRVVLLMLSHSPFSEQGRRELDEIESRAVKMSAHIDLSGVKAPRMSLYGYDNTDGTRFIWDLAHPAPLK